MLTLAGTFSGPDCCAHAGRVSLNTTPWPRPFDQKADCRFETHHGVIVFNSRSHRSGKALPGALHLVKMAIGSRDECQQSAYRHDSLEPALSDSRVLSRLDGGPHAKTVCEAKHQVGREENRKAKGGNGKARGKGPGRQASQVGTLDRSGKQELICFLSFIAHRSAGRASVVCHLTLAVRRAPRGSGRCRGRKGERVDTPQRGSTAT